MDLAVAALACDQTRILTFQWSYSESEHLFGFLNITGNHHAISHDFSSSGANYDAYNKIQTWYQQQFAYLLGKMDAIKEGDRDDARQQHRAVGDRDRRIDAARPDDDALRAGGQRERQDPRRAACSTSPATSRDNNQMLVSIGQAMGDRPDLVRRRLRRDRAAAGPGLARLAWPGLTRPPGDLTLAIRWRWRRSTSARCCKRSSRLWASRRSPCTNSASPSRRDCRPHACRDCRPSAG